MTSQFLSSSDSEGAGITGVMPNSFNIGAKRRVKMCLTDDLEYLAIDFAPTPAEYLKALKDNVRSLPTPSSIYLCATQLLIVLKHIEELKALRQKVCCGKEVDFVLELGGEVRFTASSKYRSFQFRRYWKPKPESKPLPTKTGVSLKETEFLTFLAVLPAFAKNIVSFEGGDELQALCNQMIAESEEWGEEDEEEEEEEREENEEKAEQEALSLPNLNINTPINAGGMTPPPTPSPEKAKKKPSFRRVRGIKRLESEDEGEETSARVIVLSDGEQDSQFQDSQFHISRIPPAKTRRVV